MYKIFCKTSVKILHYPYIRDKAGRGKGFSCNDRNKIKAFNLYSFYLSSLNCYLNFLWFNIPT